MKVASIIVGLLSGVACLGFGSPTPLDRPAATEPRPAEAGVPGGDAPAAPAGAATAPRRFPDVTLTNPKPTHIVTLREEADLDAVLTQFDLRPMFVYRFINGFAAALPPAALAGLTNHPQVLAVEADGPVSLCEQTNGTGVVRMEVDQFPVARINGITEPLDVDVAVLDTGIDPIHPDLSVHHFYSPFTSDPTDVFGHGTKVAGVLAALDNDIGTVGVAPGVRLWSIKVQDPDHLNYSYFLSSLGYVLQYSNEVEVVNISLGNTGSGAPINSVRLGIRRLVNAGIVVVAAAGNDARDIAGVDGLFGSDDDAIPAALAESMAVSAIQPTNDTIWAYSNFSQIERTNIPSGATVANYVASPGGAIDVAAPGVGILTTTTNAGYSFLNGTSFAAPHVAGLVALYIAANGRATNAAGVYAIRQAIINASLPQSQWSTTNTGDPDTNPEPMAIASEAWIPGPLITSGGGAPGNFPVSFAAVPGYQYTVQSATNLTPPTTWSDVGSVIGVSNTQPASITATNLDEQSYYRLRRSSPLGPFLISAQPASFKTPAGSTTTFRVEKSGREPFGFLWHKDAAPLSDVGNITGSTSAQLMVTNVQPADAGAYHVVITNSLGSLTSLVASLTVLTNWTTALVTGVLATATSEIGSIGRYASNTVSGTGVWESVGVNQGFGTDVNPAITFDLGSERALERVEVWNGPEPLPAVQTMEIKVSSDGTNFSTLGRFTLTTLTPASETIGLQGVVGRYVRFCNFVNGAGPAPGMVMLDQVEFHEYQGN